MLMILPLQRSDRRQEFLLPTALPVVVAAENPDELTGRTTDFYDRVLVSNRDDQGIVRAVISHAVGMRPVAQERTWKFRIGIRLGGAIAHPIRIEDSHQRIGLDDRTGLPIYFNNHVPDQDCPTDQFRTAGIGLWILVERISAFRDREQVSIRQLGTLMVERAAPVNSDHPGGGYPDR